MINENKQPTAVLWLEMGWLFGCLPASLSLSISIWIKLSLVITGLVYCLWVSNKMGLLRRHHLLNLSPYKGSLMTGLRFLTFAVCSTILVALYLPDALFSVVLGAPLLWLAICVFYSLFSVYPQEFLYRVFFFKRYQGLISNPYLFIMVNGVLFSFAHLFFMNTLVFLLTFVGGILFAFTYKKSQSLVLTSIEHSAYGLWLFTLGLGEMLAFPGA